MHSHIFPTLTLIAVAASQVLPSGLETPGTTHYKIAAFKDSFISYSPEYSTTTFGKSKVLRTWASGSEQTSVILGFTLPSESTQAPSRISACTLELPPYAPESKNATIMLTYADHAWDEETVNGANAPAKLNSETYSATFDKLNGENLLIDIAEICRNAASAGTGLSLYVTSNAVPYTMLSREGGKPANLYVDVI